MPNIEARDANNVVRFLRATGLGTDADPFVQSYRSGGSGQFIRFTENAGAEEDGYAIFDLSVSPATVTVYRFPAGTEVTGIIDWIEPSGSSASSAPGIIAYQIDGTPPTQYGIVSADGTTVAELGTGTATAIGTGAGEAQPTGGETSSAPVDYLGTTILEVPVTGDTTPTATRPTVGELITTATGYAINAATTWATITLQMDEARFNQFNDTNVKAEVRAENYFLALITDDGTTVPSIATVNGIKRSNESNLTLTETQLSNLRIVGNQDPTGNSHARASLIIQEYSGDYPGPHDNNIPPIFPDDAASSSSTSLYVTEATGITVNATDTTLIELELTGAVNHLNLQLQNTGANPFSSLVLQTRANTAANWGSFASVADDFPSNGDSLVRGVIPGPGGSAVVNLSAGDSKQIILTDVVSIRYLRVVATSATGTTADIYITGGSC